MIQLMLPNGMRFAIDAAAITAVEENEVAMKDSDGKEFKPAIVWAAGHRFVTAAEFEGVYNSWVHELYAEEMPERHGENGEGTILAEGSEHE